MRSVVRSVLTRVAKTGLPGEHHFYVAFNTQAPGVTISKRLKEKYPAEMTIVLQHRFWDLIVSEERFEVKLTFDSIPERLVVPFRAVKVFFDPSVPYGLQFEQSELGSEAARRLGGEVDGGGMPDMPTIARNDGPMPGDPTPTSTPGARATASEDRQAGRGRSRQHGRRVDLRSCSAAASGRNQAAGRCRSGQVRRGRRKSRCRRRWRQGRQARSIPQEVSSIVLQWRRAHSRPRRSTARPPCNG